MKNVIEVCPNSKALEALRRGYPDLPYEKQCHGEEFRKNTHILVDQVMQNVFENEDLSVDEVLHVALPLRAALAFIFAFKDLSVNVKFHLVDVHRDEQTAQTLGMVKFNSLGGTNKFLCADIMLATGSTHETIFKAAKEAGFNGQFIVCGLVTAPEGVKRIHSNFPDTKVYTASLDSHLNEKFYIEPGLGDAGDKYNDGIQGNEAKVREYIESTDNIANFNADEKQVIYQRLMK